jgi:hypothetical protein
VKAVSYFTSFRKLILVEPISDRIELIPGVNITNNPAVKKEWLTPSASPHSGL